MLIKSSYESRLPDQEPYENDLGQRKNMIDFKPGDLARLKSGGPKMAVRDVDPDNGEVYCQWFVGNMLNQDHFPKEVLVGLPPTGDLVSPVGDITFHGITFNKDRRTLLYNGRLIYLTPHEASMIDLFLSQPGIVFTHAEIVLLLSNKIMDDKEAAELTRPLMHRLVGKIRSVLGEEKWFRSVKGTGYLFEKGANE
jgi:uncharacterized protein YodC (DUF2158 family)/DNA-binding winged helix-turn-helix (wHTH) protein